VVTRSETRVMPSPQPMPAPPNPRQWVGGEDLGRLIPA
jgi:hypothetical protein